MSHTEHRDDRTELRPEDRVLLIVENDPEFADFLLETAHKSGFKGLITPSGASALALVRDVQPHAVSLDISLPDIDGWRVLKRLKSDLDVRHIPVYVISTVDEPERGLKLGAQDVLAKPIKTAEQLEQFLDKMRGFVERSDRRLVLVEPDTRRRDNILQLLEGPDLEILVADTGGAAIKTLAHTPVDGIILPPQLPDMSLAALAEKISTIPDLSAGKALLYLGTDVPESETARWKRMAQEFNLRLVSSPQELADQTALLLCRPLGKMREHCRQMIRELSDPAKVLAGKKVLIVDDDIRNIFALTSVLERYDLVTVSAETGRDAINLLQAAPDVDIVLMDIMMPEMDGIDTMKAIRQISHFKKLPIVAVTAKAMKGDREKCIEAGAWDYLSKPVDSEQMLSVLRAWLAE
jgi:CheY-like chemotaxis protein